MPDAQDKTNTFDRTKELTDRLEAGMNELYQSDKYKDYLKAMSHFHHYSSRNIALINMQMPNATRVASFKLWEEQFDRHVKKGEHAIRIFAPIAVKESETKLMEKLDPETKASLLDENGKPIMEEMTLLTNVPKFKLVPVFDVSQTYGEPLPELIENLTGNVEHYGAFLDSLIGVSPVPVIFEPLPENKDGYCRYGEQIGIRDGMSEAQTIAAVIHELAHARLHDKGLMIETADLPRAVKEVQAESVAYVVCQHYGIETALNSFGYLAEWGGKDMKSFKASLDTIRKESHSLINDIDDKFKVICQERGIDLTAKQPEKTLHAPDLQEEQQYTSENRTENIAGVDFVIEDIIPQSQQMETDLPEETYEITYWLNGTGTLALHYFNEGSERYGDYEELASIDPDRSVTFLKNDLPDDVKERISSYALTADIPNMVAEVAKASHISENYEIIPDPSIGVSEMNLYGYMYEGMLPLTQERALELFDNDSPVFLLYDNGTEAMAFERTEIETFNGIFGIERGDWQLTKEYADMCSANSESAKESRLINGNADIFAIYQLKDSDELRYHRFTSMKQLESDNLSVDRTNYNLVYTAPLVQNDTLDWIYEKFNVDHPQDFTGHSLSVSDVVVLQRSGEITSHYVDSFGLVQLPEFLGNEKQLEKAGVHEVAEKTIHAPVVDDINISPSENVSITKTVYKQTLSYARENDELDAYRESSEFNHECREAIDKAINSSRYDTYHYNLKDAVKAVNEQYGSERVELIMAKVVQSTDYDGRYSRQNKDWAKSFEIPHGMKDVYSNTYPCLIDGFIDKLREKPSVLETLRSNAEKSRQQDAPKSEMKKEKGAEI